ncbi:MAG: flagellar M-ring protein FliF [Bacteroidota bacterium]|nr:flagellar M-ring protein FliF [Bacteroidota bacterium]
MAKIALMDQMKGFFGRLTKIQKIIIGTSIIGVIAALAVILFSTSGKEYAVLYKSLEEGDAGQIVAKLKEKVIDYKLEDNGSTILVEKEKVYDTRLSLASEGLPESGVVGYELFDKTNLGMSEFVQKLNFRRALEGELSRTVGSMDEVKKARVHIVIPEKALFEKDQKTPTASVTLKLKSGRSISKISIEGIQNLIASSIEGLQPEHVTIVDQRGKVISPPPLDEQSVAGLTSMQYEQQRKVEQYLSSKVQTLLDGVLGTGNSEVRVNSELDFTQIEKTVTDFDPERQVVRSEQQIAETSKSADSLSYPYVNMDKNQSNVISNYEISKSVEKIVQGVGVVKRLSIAALINGTVKVTEKDGSKSLEYIPRSDKEIQKLTEIVKNAVGFDPSRNDQVSVMEFPFDTSLQQEDLEDYYQGPWWKNPDNQKLMVLIMAMLLTIFILFRVLQSKQIKDRIRLALGLPDKVIIEDEEEKEEELEELDFDEEFLLLPAELPEQLLLEGEKEEKELELPEEEFEEMPAFDKDDLASQARAKLEEYEAGEMTEEMLMKLELKNKVQSYIDDQTDEAVRLIRVFISQDQEDRANKF